MSLRHLILLTLAWTAVDAALAAAEEKSTKPNILFILSDDVGYGDLGFMGHPYVRTPTIDKLSRDGTLFKNFYVSGPVCSPTRTGLMTGRFPATFQKIPASHGFSGAITVTELLRRAGYRTAHFGKWHLGPTETSGTYGMYGIETVKIIANERFDPRGRDAGITDAVIAYLRAHKKDEPFYVNVWYHTVHNPVNPPQIYVDQFKNLKVNPSDFKNPDMARELEELKKSGDDIDLGMRKHVGDMLQLDDQVARLLKVVDELGLADDTIVVFTSDNGPHGYGSAGLLRGKKHSLHDGGVHLPLLVRWPGHVKAGRVDEKSVLAGVDWMPTLCSIAGAKFDRTPLHSGEDVSDIWLGAERARKTDLFWRTFAPKAPHVILRGSWKMLEQRKGPPELYDLAKDPGERNNVAPTHPEVVRELTTVLNRWAATLPKSYIGMDNDK
jgi:N-acetylgalactosamine-6-sulfatase